VYNNRFTFNGLEFVGKKLRGYIIYTPQAPIAIHQNGGILSVSAGARSAITPIIGSM